MELLFLLIGIGGTCLYYRKRVKARVQFDEETKQRNQSLYQENETLIEENDLLKLENTQLLMERAAKAQDAHDQAQFLDELIHEKESVEKEIVVLKESMNDLKTAKDELYSAQEELAQANFEKALERMAKDIQESMVAYKRVAEFLDTEEEIQNSVHTTKEKLCGDISFNKVSFGYDKKEPVLKDINLKINKGEFVAFVGPSGCGKSTLAGLIPRFYDVESGSVSIDGINVKDIDLHTLRQEIGIVQQDIYLFNGTVYDNIAYAVPEASFDDVVRAAKLANAHDFITSLSDGYNTDIGDKGVKLSGGQKQRIAIARLFLLNPQIVIFDEATSALDNNSEKVVQEALEKIASDRTTIVIAHRLSTIRNADKIVFLSTNGIEEVGTHDELMELGGCYAQLYNSSNH